MIDQFYDDRSEAILQTADGGFAILWRREHYSDVYLTKLSSAGKTVWTRSYGGPDYDAGHSLATTADGGFIIAGMTRSFSPGDTDVYLVRTDGDGNLSWERTYGGPGDDWARSVDLASDGGFIIAGGTQSFGAGSTDVYLIKTDDTGDTVWTRTYGGAGDDEARSVQQVWYAGDVDGFIVAGSTELVAGTGKDFYTLKTTQNGDVEWTESYGQPDGNDVFECVRQTQKGGYVFAGYRQVAASSSRLSFMAMSHRNGRLDAIWMTDRPQDNWLNSVWATQDGGFVAVGAIKGTRYNNMYAVKLDYRLFFKSSEIYAWEDEDVATDVIQSSEGSLLILGWTNSLGRNGTNLYVMRTSDEVPPSPPEDFTATPHEGAVELRWTVPSVWDATGVHIRYATKTYPLKPDWGSPVPNSSDGCFDGPPGSDSSFTHPELEEYTNYYYCAFAYDVFGNYSEPARAKTSLPDSTPPVLTLALFQDPQLSQQIDVYVIGSEPLPPGFVDVRADRERLTARAVDTEERIYLADYTLPDSTGTVSLIAHSIDWSANPDTVAAAFSYALLAPAQGGTISSPDDNLTVEVRRGAPAGSTVVIVVPCIDSDERDLEIDPSNGADTLLFLAPEGIKPSSYYIGPTGLLSGQSAHLEWRYHASDLGEGCTPDQIYIEHDEIGPLESFIDPSKETVVATVSRLGHFSLRVGEKGTSSTLDHSFIHVNSTCPNPFSSQTAFQVEVHARQRVDITVYDVRGRLVAEVFAGTLYPGTHEFVWNGVSSGGSEVSSGVYIATVETLSRVAATKLILTR
ncbi:MAG: FlgD immunoglobulin-like domain containing protein [Candidatus Eisenbacteria bacterium]